MSLKRINESEVPSESRTSPQGKFAMERQHISLALGGVKDTGEWGGGHPFDIERTVLAPGKRNYPLHSHAAQWEQYIILSGRGKFLNAPDHAEDIGPGDHILCPPGEAHQIWNDGDEPLVYYVIADHHRSDVTTYPNTGKRQLKPEYRVVQVEDADYYDGEE